MSDFSNKKPFKLQPSEALSQEMLEKLKQINEKFSKSGEFSNYMQDLSNLFGIPAVKVTADHKKFLGGFIEGEGSLNVSIKKLKTAQFGVLLDPEFSITQHVNGFATLYLALSIFRKGRIRHKAGSNATLVLVIDNRKTLEEIVIPYYKQHVVPYGSPAKAERLDNFIKILEYFKQDGHKDLKTFRDKMLPIWDSMRMQKGQSNETFQTLQEAQTFITDFVKNKP